ncbi:alpha/beta hydrolase domain-containing protein [Mycolicibacterium setense]
MAVPVPTGAGAACSTARVPRTWAGESVPALADGYVETEHFLSGTAQTYAGPVTGPVTIASDGSPYVTRILVRHPRDPGDFSGRVVVEPFNTSFGVDRDELWARAGGLLQTEGDAWVGITGRAMGAAELRRLDLVRYAQIDFPINDLGWDALCDLGFLIKSGGQGSPLGQLDVRRVYLAGYSQSAVDVATFAIAFTTTARLPDGSAIYDGYFPAAHAASCSAIGSGDAWRPEMEYVSVRDVGVPVIEVQPQTDVEGFFAEINSGTFVNPGSASVRRADSDHTRDRYRLYELAGAPHAARLDGCDGAGSSFPTSMFVRAALRLLFEWAEDALPPPRAARISVQSDGPVSVARVDRNGNPLGGVRSPHLDVPLARYEAHSSPGPLCQLAGAETPLPTETLIARYRNANRYLDEFTAALEAAISARYILPADREQILRDVAARAQDAFRATDYQEVSIP